MFPKRDALVAVLFCLPVLSQSVETVGSATSFSVPFSHNGPESYLNDKARSLLNPINRQYPLASQWAENTPDSHNNKDDADELPFDEVLRYLCSRMLCPDFDEYPEEDTGIECCPGVLFFPGSDNDSDNDNLTCSEEEESAEEDEAGGDNSSDHDNSNVINIHLNQFSLSGTKLEADISWAEIPAGSYQNPDADVYELLSLVRYLLKRTEEARERAEMNKKRYGKLAASIARRDPDLSDIYLQIKALFYFCAHLYQQRANQLLGLLYYVNSMAFYSIPEAGPLNFPLLFRNLGIDCLSNPEQLMIRANSREHAFRLNRLIELLTSTFRTSYKFFTVIDQNTAATMADWLKSTGLTQILEIGAGLGWMQQALSAQDIIVKATDNYDFFYRHIQGLIANPYPKKMREPKSSDKTAPPAAMLPSMPERPQAQSEIALVPAREISGMPRKRRVTVKGTMAGTVEQMDQVDAAKKHRQSANALLLANPSHDSFIDALNAWGSEKPVIFISVPGIRAYCNAARKRCNTRPYEVQPPDLSPWSSMEGYQRMEVFYWLGTD